MKRSLSLVNVLLLATVACDPDLTVQKAPSTTPSPDAASPPSDPPTPSLPGDGGAPDSGELPPDASVGHVVDGVNDFDVREKLDTTSSTAAYHAYAAWDDRNIYLGMEGSDVAAGTPNAAKKWLLLYLAGDGGNGSRVGLGYDCGGTCPPQQPALSFAATHHFRWKVDASYANAQAWNGTAWVDAGVGLPITVQRSGTFVELAVPRSALGATSKLSLHMNMMIEADQTGHTYAGVPNTSFTDQRDPDFAKHYEFDLNDAATPSGAHPVRP